ncbi:MAG: FAD-dependent oxidoreductase [Candidatus Acidiferrum sp.]
MRDARETHGGFLAQRKINRRKMLTSAAAAGAGSLAAAGGVNVVSPLVLPETLTFEENHSFWSRALPSPNPSLAEDLAVDVAVIGGGLTGLSASYYLQNKRPLRSVVLLEAQRCGSGASARNGGMLLTLTEDRYMQSGSDFALDKRIYDLTSGNIRALRGIAVAANIDCDIETRGALQVCNTPEQFLEGREYLAKARQSGIPVELWDRHKTAQALGTDVYAGALFDPSSGQVHPGKLVAALKAAAESAGVRICEGSEVRHIAEGPTHRLTTSAGFTVKAKTLVLATNAFSSKLGYLRSAICPVFDYVGITAPLSDAQLSALEWKSRIPFNDSRVETYYLGLTSDNRIHIGGGPVDYCFNNGTAEPASAQQGYQRIHQELLRIFPALQGVPFETTWSGVVDMSLDQSPAVGVLGKYHNILYGIGFSGHGVNLTSLFGRIIADLATGSGEQWAWLPFVNRLPPYIPNEPFRWLGIESALRYYRLRDPKTP